MTDGEQKKLNEEQKQAVEHGEGPLLVIAGAGTGKTTVITERIKWLVSQGKGKPSEILALTFTDKAAREMEERVDIAMPYGYTQMWISTFHAFCDRLLRSEALQIGLDPNYNLLTEAETVQFLRQNLFKFDLWGALGPNPNPNDPWYGFHRFKEGYGGQLVEFIGTYDLVLNPYLYPLYNLADRMRWFLLRTKSRLPV